MSGPNVLVVGAGIIGRSVGHHLALMGAQVDIIDAGDGPSQTSRASLGILTHFNGGDNPYSDLYRDGHQGYAALAEQIRSEVGVDIDWRPMGGIDLNFDEVDEEEAEAKRQFNRERGCEVEWLEAAQVRGLESHVSDRVRSGLYFPGDHRVDAEKLAHGLRACIESRGGRVSMNEAMETAIQTGEGGIEIETSRQRRRADYLVLAAGCWTGGIGARLDASVAVRPVRGQHGRFSAGTDYTGHVVRHGLLQSIPAETAQVIVGATTEESGFDATTTASAMEGFRDHWRHVFCTPPQSCELRAGLRPKPKGGRPMIGRLPGWERVFVATGHYKNGILLGPITGRLIAEWIVEGRPSRSMQAFAVRG